MRTLNPGGRSFARHRTNFRTAGVPSKISDSHPLRTRIERTTNGSQDPSVAFAHLESLKPPPVFSWSALNMRQPHNTDKE